MEIPKKYWCWNMY